MNNLVWVFFSMAGISTPTPGQRALLDPSQTLTATDGKEMFLARWQARP
jgi:hypothetical protein